MLGRLVMVLQVNFFLGFGVSYFFGGEGGGVKKKQKCRAQQNTT